MLILSDPHLGKVQDTIQKDGIASRLFDCVARIKEVVDYATAVKETLIIAGDVFDNSAPAPDVIEQFIKIIKYARQRGVKIIVIPGNHDCGARYMSMQYATEDTLDNLTVVDRPRIMMVDHKAVALLPHVPKHVCESKDYMDYALKCLSSKKYAQYNNKIDVLIGHAHLTGAVNSSDVELEAGNAIAFNPSDFFKYKLGVFGHIHRYQILKKKNVYCGPVVTNSFDEAKIEKGFVRVLEDCTHAFIPFQTEETQYAHIKINLIDKDAPDYDPVKMKKFAKDKIIKLSVYARDAMQVDQVAITKKFNEYGTVVRFESIVSERYTGELESDEVDDVIETINYKPVLKKWIKAKSDVSDDLKSLAIELGSEIIEEVMNDSRNKS